MSGAQDFSEVREAVAGGPTLGWVLKRTAMCLVILGITVTTAAWLLYAGIQPEGAEARDTAQIGPATTGSLPASRD